MTVFQALLLGLIQGLTEFLPISSSGHLVVAQHFVGLAEASLPFDVFLHFSTLLAVIMYFRHRIIALKSKDWMMIAIASVPAVILGLLLKDWFEVVFRSYYIVLGTLFITGVINLKLGHMLKHSPVEASSEVTPKKALLIGLFQAVALLPGISRSGSTVFGAITQKLSRIEAFSFSFIMSIPVILGGSVLQLLFAYDSGELATIEWVPFLLGGAAAFLAGVVSLRVFRYVIEKARFEWFGWYCVGLVVVLVLFDIVPVL